MSFVGIHSRDETFTHLFKLITEPSIWGSENKMDTPKELRASEQFDPFMLAQDPFPLNVPDLDPDWAERNPERAMAWLYVTPRPCEALERLLRS